MQILPSPKYGFRIRTRSGVVVDNLSISGKNEPDAERKLCQIYQGCEILETRHVVARTPRVGPVNYEDVVDLIAGDESPPSRDYPVRLLSFPSCRNPCCPSSSKRAE